MGRDAKVSVRGKSSKGSTSRYMLKSQPQRSKLVLSVKPRPTMSAQDERRIDRFVDWFVDRMFGD